MRTGPKSSVVKLTLVIRIDDYQLCVHPTILGQGLPLFKDIQDRVDLKLIKTKTFGRGAITLYYEPAKKKNNEIIGSQPASG